jgi:hypothetical protein
MRTTIENNFSYRISVRSNYEIAIGRPNLCHVENNN